MDVAPDEIHDEEDDQRERDRKAGNVDGIGHPQHTHEPFFTAEEEVVECAEPVRIACVHHEGDASSAELFVGMEKVQRPSARVRQIRPVAVGVDQLVVEEDVDILVRRGEQKLVDDGGRVRRNYAGEIDRLRPLRQRWLLREFVGMPFERIVIKADDILVFRGVIAYRIL